MKTKTSITFTADELEILKTALNRYDLEMMEKSKTYAKSDDGSMDYYHEKAYEISALWSRVYKASVRLYE